MKEHLLTLTQRNDKPLKAPFAHIMGLESDTPLKLAEENEDKPAHRLSSGTALDHRATGAFSRAHIWLIGLALLCLSLSYWVISRYRPF